MRYEHLSGESGDEATDSLYGESSHEVRETPDERILYGEPCHEETPDRDEQTLYGEPQHESRDGDRDLPDLELLFARMRAQSATGPSVRQSRATTTQATTHEQ